MNTEREPDPAQQGADAPQRTTVSGSELPRLPAPYLWFADIYTGAACNLLRVSSPYHLPAVLQLLGMGIELALKGYLVHKGARPEDLVRTVWHHLDKALEAALGDGLAQVDDSLGTDVTMGVVRDLSKVYAGEGGRRYRHLVYPHPEDLTLSLGPSTIELARRILRACASGSGMKLENLQCLRQGNADDIWREHLESDRGR